MMLYNTFCLLFESKAAFSGVLHYSQRNKVHFIIKVLNHYFALLFSQGVVALDRFHHKLSFEGLPNEATRLRCKTNFHALRFVKPILDFSLELVSRIKSKERYLQKDSLMKSASEYPNKTSITGKKEAGYFLGLHLRFEKDMIAHSACYYGGGRAEQQALASYRRKIFRWSLVL